MGNPHSLDNVNCHLEEEDKKEEKEAERAVRPMEGEKRGHIINAKVFTGLLTYCIIEILSFTIA